MRAIIKDNIPYCGECSSPLGNTEDYKLVEYQGEDYVEFTRYCTKKYCTTKSSYLLTLDMDGETRTSFVESEIKEIVDK